MVFIHSGVKGCLDFALSEEAAVARVIMVAGFRPVNSRPAGNSKCRDRQRENKEHRDE